MASTSDTTANEQTQPKPQPRSRLGLLVGVLVVLAIVLVTQRRQLAAIPNGQARAALVRRDADTAEQWLQRAERIAGKNGESEFLRARMARRDGRMDDVRRHIRRAKEMGYDAVAIQREEWLACAQSGQMDIAEPYLGSLLQDPMGDEQEICEAYIIGYFKLRRFNVAYTLLATWLEDHPEDAQPYFWRGALNRENDNPQGAIEDMTQALTLDPGHTKAALILGETLLGNKRTEEALPYLQLARSDATHGVAASITCSMALRNLGRLDEARAMLEQTLADAKKIRDVERAELVTELSTLYIEQGEYPLAVERIEEVLPARPNHQKLRYTLGVALRGVGRDADAKKHLDFAAEAAKALDQAGTMKSKVDQNPNDAELRYELGKIYLQYGSPEEGLLWLQSALQVDAYHRPTHHALMVYYESKVHEGWKNVERAQEHRQLAFAPQQGQPSTPPPSTPAPSTPPPSTPRPPASTPSGAPPTDGPSESTPSESAPEEATPEEATPDESGEESTTKQTGGDQ